MTPQRRNGIYQLYVARQSGGVVSRSTGTKDAPVYRGMKRMLAELKDGHRWTLLGAVAKGDLTLGQLYDAHTANRLDALERSLSATALGPHVAGYLATCRARGLAPRNVENLARQLASFLTVATTTADLTPGIVTGWLAGLTTSPGTRRQYLYAVTGFARYLLDVDVLRDYPLTRVQAPKKNAARMRYEDAATDEQIVQAASPRYRALFAMVKATGADLSTALSLTARDIDWHALTVRLRGTKTAQRDVHQGVIERWALPYIKGLATVLSGPLFPGLTRHGASQHHRRCVTAIGLTGSYTLKDARHSVAVRMAKAGYTVFEIAEQLGNSPELVARVYARFIPQMAHKAEPRATSHATSRNP